MAFRVLSELSRRSKLRTFCRSVAPGARVLEIGRGDGWFSDRLRRRGYVVTSLDLVPPADVVGDVTKWRELGLGEGAWDAVVALEVIEHVDCVREITALCRPDGTIFLSSPHPDWDWAMKVLERVGLNQKRTSPHDHLVDFETLPWQRVELRRPAVIHQVGVFRNVPRGRG